MSSFKSPEADRIAKLVWTFCKNNHIWLTASHIPGKLNIEADFWSRKIYIDSEWQLNPKIFNSYCQKLNFSPLIDCFASRLNSQLRTYISYRPDPYASHIDAFTKNWAGIEFYMFPLLV